MMKERLKHWARRVTGLKSGAEAEREKQELATELENIRKETMLRMAEDKRETALILRSAGQEETARTLEAQASRIEEKKEAEELLRDLGTGFGLDSLYS